VELGLLEKQSTVRIRREDVDELRAVVVGVSVAQVATAILQNDGNIPAAFEDLQKLLGLRSDADVVVAESEGERLYLNDQMETGYRGVWKSKCGRFYEARVTHDNKVTVIGTFPTATKAAVAYAKHYQAWVSSRREARLAGQGAASSSSGNGVNGKSEGNVEAKQWGRARQAIGFGDGIEQLKRQAAFNKGMEPLLSPGSSDPSGVVAINVNPADAELCAQYLERHWTDGRLILPDGQRCFGYGTYTKTLNQHDSEQQRLHTLLLTSALLPAVRAHVPGFSAMEESLLALLQQRCGSVFELFYAHGLRQGPDTLRSTGFSVHQDTEDFDFIDYSIVCKLTPDDDGEPPSKMSVVGAEQPFIYTGAAGSGGLFRSRLYHSSVAPESRRQHLKVAFFFRENRRGERAVKRAHAALGAELESASWTEQSQQLVRAQLRQRVALDLNASSLGREAPFRQLLTLV
jgi:hypothetical protein